MSASVCRCQKWEWKWVGMGMGMTRWEWEGNVNKKVIPAHLYYSLILSIGTNINDLE